MANNLTPEQLAWLRQQQDPYGLAALNPNYGMAGTVTNADGSTWHPLYQGTQGSGAEGDHGSQSISGYQQDVTPGQHGDKSWYDQYDPQGNYIGRYQVQNPSALADYAPFALTAAFMAPFVAPGLLGAGGTGAAGAMGDAAALNAATDAALIDTAAGATGVGTIGAGAAGGSGLLSTLGKGAAALGSAVGGGSNLLGLGATALGALAGSKGQKNETTATRQLPDYLQGPVTNDLIPRAQGLLAQQMTPERMAGYAAMRQAGQGLLGQPIAGNGFSLFSGRR